MDHFGTLIKKNFLATIKKFLDEHIDHFGTLL